MPSRDRWKPAPRPVSAAMLALACAGGLAARASLDGPAAKYLGVALYAVAMHWLVALVRPRWTPAAAALAALGACWAIEFAQLTPVPAWLSARHTLFRLTLGSTFHPPDLAAYAAGAALAGLLHGAIARARGAVSSRHARPDPPPRP